MNANAKSFLPSRPAAFFAALAISVATSSGADGKAFNSDDKNSPPVLQEIPDQVMTRNQAPRIVILEASDADNDPLSFSAIAREYHQLWELDEQYGFRRTEADYHENFLGMGEKWIQAAKDSDNWYVILPNGDVRRWLGGSSLAPAIVTLDSSAHANPALLHSPDAPAFALRELDEQYGFYQSGDKYFENTIGMNEKWIRAENDADNWYVILPGGELHRWLGGSNLAPVAASVGPAVHADPALLHDAPPPPSLPVTLSFLGTKLLIEPESSYTGTFRVIVTVSDGADSDSKAFLVKVTNEPPVLAAIADQVLLQSEGPLTVALNASDPDGDPLIFSAVAREYRQLWELDDQYGFYQSDPAYHENFLGMNEQWIQAAKESDNWYVIFPNGDVRRWLGGSSLAPPIVALDASVHANPALLHSPDAPAFALHELNEHYGFYQSDPAYHENFLGMGEKWIRAADESDNWYVILPSGELRRWLGGTSLGPVAGSVGPAVHANPALLHDAQPAPPLPVDLSFSGSDLTITAEADFNQTFRVVVTVSDGLVSDSKTFLVAISAAPLKLLITSIKLERGDLVLTWAGGSGPFTLEKKSSITGSWSDEVTGIQGSGIAIPFTGEMGFFRVRGQ